MSMLTIRHVLLLVCLFLVAGLLLTLLWLWPTELAGWGADSTRRLPPNIIAAALLVAALIAMRAAIIIVGPIDALHRSAQRMAAGELNVRVPEPDRFAPRELLTLTAAFNDMAASVSQLRTEAERINASKSEFMRTVTHELRSPLSAIIGFSDLLTNRTGAPLPPEACDAYVRDINAGARHLLALVNDLLDLARAEAGQYELVEDEVWLDAVMKRAARYVELEARARHMQVIVASDGEAPCVNGDERALFQVLLNLASNAVRYGRSGGTVTITSQHLSDGSCAFSVCDDGGGISADDLARVMLPFQRAPGAHDAGIIGSGLGLPIVKRFVELHGGTFTLVSTVGVGTTARVELPRSRVRQCDPAPSGGAADADVAKAA
jgi:signal transduction histidine kinase